MSKIKNETQLYRLFKLLTDAGEKGVKKDQIVTDLGVKDSSVPVYIHSLKKKFKAEITNVTEGRVVTGYVLTNTPEVPQYKRAVLPLSKKSNVASTSVATGEAPILDTDVNVEYSEREVADIGNVLGVSDSGYSQEY